MHSLPLHSSQGTGGRFGGIAGRSPPICLRSVGLHHFSLKSAPAGLGQLSEVLKTWGI